jgi:acetyl/propionyl-CoA carboxylase alpha subunit
VSARHHDGHWKVEGAVHAVTLKLEGSHAAGAVDGTHLEALVRAAGPGRFTLTIGGRRTLVVTARRGDRLLVSIGGRAFELARVEAGGAAGSTAAGDPFVVSPMTGLVTKVHVKPGDRAVKGQPLFAVEAMKMEYVVKADRDVVIAEVKVVAGARVAVNEPAVTFETEAAP